MNLKIFVLFIIFTSCSNASLKERELEIKERELEIREQELNSRANPLNNEATPNDTHFESPRTNTKFVYVIINTSIPILKTNELEHLPTFGDPYIHETIMEEHLYTSNVIEIADYDREKQYKIMDAFESKIRDVLFEMDRRYQHDVTVKVGTSEDEKYDAHSIINSKKCNVFDTYEAASIDRSKKTN